MFAHVYTYLLQLTQSNAADAAADSRLSYNTHNQEEGKILCK
jgi:hypothetical protein